MYVVQGNYAVQTDDIHTNSTKITTHTLRNVTYFLIVHSSH